MKWTKMALTTTAEAEDLVINLLGELGIDGVEISDNVPITEEEKKKMFIDILPELDESDKTAVISFYLEEDENQETLLQSIHEGLEELRTFVEVGAGTIEVSETEDKDWINNWKEFFKPFRVDDTIVIKPTWQTLAEKKEDDIVIDIDPGVAFGTGSHETTKLCILNIKKYLKDGQKILDVGCGSGILSIIAIKLGAKTVAATDIDPNAVTAAHENAEVNQVVACDTLEELGKDGKQMGIFAGDIISDANFRKSLGEESYDLVVANILADVIIPLSAVIAENMKPGALFISSGIIEMKREEVKAALLCNQFEIVEETKMGDWVSFVCRKKVTVQPKK